MAKQQRFIADSFGALTQSVSTMLCKVFQQLEPVADGIFRRIYGEAGIEMDIDYDGMWACTNPDRAAQAILRYNHDQRTSGGAGNATVTTYDFSTMYTTLPLEDLVHRLRELIKRCFTVQGAGNNNGIGRQQDVRIFCKPGRDAEWRVGVEEST